MESWPVFRQDAILWFEKRLPTHLVARIISVVEAVHGRLQELLQAPVTEENHLNEPVLGVFEQSFGREGYGVVRGGGG